MAQVTAKKSYLKDENGNYIIPYINNADLNKVGVVKPDGTTITANNGVISSTSQLPSQTGHSGEYLKTDGTNASWASIDLSGKADKDLTNATPTSAFATAMNTAGIRTIISTYLNGTEWYRVYSDGWCEQGGSITPANGEYTVYFLKAFADTNYVILKNWGIDSNAGANGFFIGFRDKTASSAKTTNSSAANNSCWFACGYIS